MKTRNFGGKSRSSGINMGMIVRVTLATFAVVGSLVMAWLLMAGHLGAHAAGVSTITTKGKPWGEALDAQGHLWVAGQSSGKQATGYIGEFNLTNPQTGAVETPLPTTGGYSAPEFLALDATGNVWFTEPATDAIGELSGTTFQNITTGITKGSAPTDLTFDNNKNIWFTEAKGSKIGFLNVTTKQVVETPLAQQNADPYGIINVNGEIWFAENAQPLLGHFHQTTTGAIHITYVPTSSLPHLLAADHSGNVWYSEGTTAAIGEYNVGTKRTQDFSGATAVCGAAAGQKTPAPGTSPTLVGAGTPPACKNIFIAGIFVDGNNQVWFDESQTGRIGLYSPVSTKAVAVTASNNPYDGLVVDTTGNVWAASKAGTVVVEVPTATLAGGSPGSGPTNKTWYFAEGRVGKGFREYLTIGNPTSTACAVNVQYLYTMDGSSTPATKTVSVNVSPASRTTESVNNDLGMSDSSTTAASLAAIVTVNTTTTPACPGVVAERPMYFSNFQGISSGTDVIGGTKLNTTYYFADVPTGAGASGRYTSYLTILNPNTTTANVTVNYFANGNQVQSQTLAVPGNARGTIAPGMVSMPQHVAAIITSDQPVMVERPTYFTGVNGIAGAYDVVGTPKAASDWLFAEGYTGPGYHEFLTIANPDPTKTASVTVTLKSGTGATNPTSLSLGPKSQMIWDVNAANIFSGSTPEVSAEVATTAAGSVVNAAASKTPTPGTPTATPTPTGAGVVVQREIYFTYKHTLPQQAVGGTDVMGQVGPAAHSSYSFAEGYTNMGYNEWLTIQNPTGNAETIYVTLVNGMAKSSTQSFSVQANSRFTLDVTALVQQLFSPGTNSSANSISATVQTLDGSPFVVERPMYWDTGSVSPFVTKGGSDAIGYVGG